MDIQDIQALIRDIPDFPKPGILFRDITTLLKHPQGFRSTIDLLAQRCGELSPDYILGMESRGFIFGTPVAYQLNCGFIPVRKPKKLPAPVYQQSYDLEYGQDQLEMHQDALKEGDRVVVVDDLIATGGTAKATAELIEQAGAVLAGFVFVIELEALEGRKNLPDVPISSLIQY
ncbi:adenine phosphoribosyltransferase [Roseofilum capinflatum]|uniref:Adenine phosphoribosyltransferase n=1 Tax=Roseofilum capinflatum BLCC-M114 TaxID=3022440 RepID=A0ABT7B548_9CYAN|nr:adenine phosphoribosyltransferase [Roseofilum capinflatum]MDJ1174303.1 adenine phosphoribosyltransferase [Roseofilum capinflatum BLCC-M114]